MIADWNPLSIVTLIDDLFAVRSRIKSEHFTISLRELYTWRMTEWLMADQLAWATGLKHGHQKPVENFLFSVKQPTHSLYSLLFRPELHRVYASFPITKTRDNARDPAIKDKINTFRARLHRMFTVFDPLTIDERIMESWLSLSSSTDVRFSFAPNPPLRWDCRVARPGDLKNFSPLLWDDDLGVAEIPVAEIQELLARRAFDAESDIDDQITYRDYRLVDQAGHVVCYRPYYGNEAHGGVDAEISYANDVTRDVYAYIADEKRVGPLRGRIDFAHRDENAFWLALEALAARPLDPDISHGRQYF